MSKLIPKKQTAWGKLEYKGPQYSQVIGQMKKEDPQVYNRLQVANARSQQPNSEVVRWKDANGKEQTSTTNMGMSGADPVGQLYIEGVVLNPVFKGLGKIAEYGLAKAGNNWARAKVLSRNLDNSPKNIDKATQAFRNSEWSNFLSTRNGDNYYRMVKSSRLPNTNIEGEKLFISHTTPWEEFSGLGTSEPIGIKVLYEFPTKTFGVRKATNYKGIPGEIDVTQMGRSHLNFGNTSSGFRGKVQLLPEQQAETIGMDPYTIGINNRPLNKGGFYNTRPDYEDIYQGNQTVVTSQELRDALLNSKYNQFEYSPSGITKKLYTPLKQKKRLIMDDKTVPAYFGKKYSVNDVVNPDGTINVRTAQRIQQETAKHYGVPPMQKRTENPVWHKDDPNTFLHTKKVTKNAWNLPIPPGYTKQDQMISAIGHDFGKIIAGDGHAQAGAGLLKQIFPDLTDDQFKAIYEHMNPIDEVQGNLSKYTKYADIGYKNTQPGN